MIFKKIKIKREQKDIHHTELNDPLPSFEVPEGFIGLEKYWLEEPYSFVHILYDVNAKENLYRVVEPRLNRFERILLEEVYEILYDTLTIEDTWDIERMDKCEYLRKRTKKILHEYVNPESLSFEKIFYYIKREFAEFGKITPLMQDTFLEDIWCNGVGIPIYVFHRAYGNIQTNLVFESDEELNSFVMRLAQQSGCHLSASNPIVDATVDCSRINITYGRDISPRGSTFSIRRFRKTPLTPIDLVAWSTFPANMMAYFWLCVENRKNMIIAGETASGKTSSLNAIGMFIPPNSRIVTLEDTREIQLPHRNWISLITRKGVGEKGDVDLLHLLRSSLRQRPEYLLVGEVRGTEAQVLFQAMNTGHVTISTIHAGSTDEVINRLTNPPINVPVMMFSALNIISVQTIAYELGAEKRRVKIVSEVVDVSEEVRLSETFRWNSAKDEFVFLGSGVLEEIRKKKGWSTKKLAEELHCRKTFIEALIERGVRDYKSVVSWINSYYRNPKEALRLVCEKEFHEQ